MAGHDGLRAGQLAAAAEVNLETLRYYQGRGLLEAPGRTLGGHRLYPRSAVTILRTIKTAQRLGFTLNEIADLVDTAQHRHTAGQGASFQSRAKAKLADVEARIADLQLIAQTLQATIEAGCDDLITCASLP